MAERDLFEQLDEIIDAVVTASPAPALAPELATLALIASDLRHLPDPRFKARLRSELSGEKENVMQATATTTGVTPYVIVEGADDLIEFLKKTFDAEVLVRVPAPGGTVMHAEVRVGDSTLEMGDSGGQWTPMIAPMHVYLEDVDSAYRRALAAGATSLYAPMTQDYGDREAGVVDRFGIQWFLATHLEGGPRPPGFGTLTSGMRAEGADRLLEFLENAFGAELVSRTDSPDGAIRHAELRLGPSMMELSEAHGQWGPTRGAFHLFVTDCDAIYAEALRAGATSLYVPEDKPYGERSAGVTDPWGNQWFIATPVAK